MKRVRIVIWTLLLLCFLCFLVNRGANEAMIEKYENGEYTQNKLSVLGFTEPYIAHYNMGNVYYKKGDYDAAVKEYEKALKLYPPHDRECKIRINLGLAMVAPFHPDDITESDTDEILETLDKARNVLYEHGCADSDNGGHNEDAKTLKEDIDRFEDELRNQTNVEQKSEPQDPDEEQEKEEMQEQEEEKKKQLQEIQKQGTEERNSELPRVEELEEFEFYDGATW